MNKIKDLLKQHNDNKDYCEGVHDVLKLLTPLYLVQDDDDEYYIMTNEPHKEKDGVWYDDKSDVATQIEHVKIFNKEVTKDEYQKIYFI